ncbi:S41 family peptidase [Arenimonas daejeonensis]|uniref:S41 family peptidase n=1 Tax=Arenimonas daejeonensis TaxID=370777 RepID=UPI0013153F4D|nr:S41 family peptidase [Arenimonas daejeonensis]
MALAPTAGAVTLPVANPGFEDAPVGESWQAPAWYDASGAGGNFVDETVAHSGTRSLRLEHRAPFAGVSQGLDAHAYRGQRLVFRAMMRSHDLAEGTSGLWIRADTAAGEAAAFEHTYLQPIAGTRDWESREVELIVPASASTLQFGIVAGAEGSLWVDDVELSASQMQALPEGLTARQYLDKALDLIQQYAYYSDRIDWPKLRASSHALSKEAGQPADTYPAIKQALAALDDNHSHFVSPRMMTHRRSETVREDYGFRSEVLGTVGYLRVPEFMGGGEAPSAAFATQIRTALRTQAEGGACGWIVDLRGNMGGAMHPMLSGLRDLLGEDELGYFVHRGDRRQPWRATGEGKPAQVDAPVAVLIDGQTASSGEAVLVSFIGRANTRSFGTATYGVSTANAPFPLDDGAALAITTALQADRTGRTYGGAIAPDEPVRSDATAVSLADDPVVSAARTWLQARPACQPSGK